MKTLTHTEKVKIENQSLKQRVQNVIGWDDLRFGNFQAAMGYRYLEEELEADVYVIDALIREKLFWSWWINHWNRRDEMFLQQFEGTLKNDLDLAYRLRHNPSAVVFKPQSTILRHSYARMMGKLIDQTHR